MDDGVKPSGWRRERRRYLTEQIITYLGNKRALLSFIGKGIARARRSLHKDKLTMFDVFSGSGVVSRYLKRHASTLWVNDLEPYSRIINECYLTNRSAIDEAELQMTLELLNRRIEANLRRGFISELYAPLDDQDIQPHERVFYTTRNAQFIDTARQEIAQLPPSLQPFFLGPLLYGASVHNNTSGVFKGFYKNREGVGQFGGTGRNSLPRILGNIELKLPLFSNFECDVHVLQEDALSAAEKVGEVDIAYLDPPYNQHPYGSNYFMLNLILDYQRPTDISDVSGIPADWRRSAYNKRHLAQATLFELVERLQARYVMISYNSEGFIQYDDFIRHLSKLGRLRCLATDYNTFRGCRNLAARNLHVKEYLFMLKKSN
ncbi:MAG: DNA adenine methylase [Oligosphaeraceae bacterium]